MGTGRLDALPGEDSGGHSIEEALPLRPKAPVAPGSVVADKYRIERILGYGGMGIVCQATHLELGTKVAIKFVRKEHMGDDRAAARFLSEARAAAQLKSQHTCHVVDCGRLESGSPYMVMEYLEGADLRSIVAKEGPLPIEESVTFVVQACEALAEAHSREIVHRDIKPENLFLTQGADGAALIKILDFGISRQLNRTRVSRALTEPTESIGSPFHMSPEQMMDPTKVDPRTDIWSLGVVLYELLTGVLPFNGESTPQVCAGVMTAEPVSPTELRPELPEGLARVVTRCLEKEREKRFSNVGGLSQALKDFGGSASSLSAARVERILLRAQSDRSDGSANGEVGFEEGRQSSYIPGLPRRRRGLQLVAGLTLVAGSAAGYYYWDQRAAKNEAEVPGLTLTTSQANEIDAGMSSRSAASANAVTEPSPRSLKARPPKVSKRRPPRVALPDPEQLFSSPTVPSGSLYPEIKPMPDLPPPEE